MWKPPHKFLGDIAPAPTPPANIPSTSSKQDDSDIQWSAIIPALRCPRCGVMICGLADTKAVNPAEAKGLAKTSVSSDYVSSPGAGEIQWRLAPCGCRVDQGFAGMYGAEINRRKEGIHPFRDICEKYKQLAQGEQKTLEEQLKEARQQLSQVGDDPNLSGVRFQAERKVVYLYDRLLKIGVGPMDIGPPLKLTKQTYAWAEKTGLLTPPQPDEIKPANNPGWGYSKTPVNPSQLSMNQKVKGWFDKPLPKPTPSPPPPPKGLVASGAHELFCTLSNKNTQAGDFIFDDQGHVLARVTAVIGPAENGGVNVYVAPVFPASTPMKLPDDDVTSEKDVVNLAKVLHGLGITPEELQSLLPLGQPQPEPIHSVPLTANEQQRKALARMGRVLRRDTGNIPDKE